MSLNIATDLLHGWLQSLELWVSQYGPRFGRCEHNECVKKQRQGYAVGVILRLEFRQQLQAVG